MCDLKPGCRGRMDNITCEDLRQLILGGFPKEPIYDCPPVGYCDSTMKKRKVKLTVPKPVCRYNCMDKNSPYLAKPKKVRVKKQILSSKSASTFTDDASTFDIPLRQRGGGENGKDSNDFDFAWYNDRYTRLHGGGCSPKKERVKWKPPGIKMFKFNDESFTATKVASKCARFNVGNAMMRPTYFAPDTKFSRNPPGDDDEQCTKNPCLGAECFVRALKETQDFVNQLGKVPGLAGLGLMDPSESPFFGRPRQILKETVIQDPKKLGHASSQPPNLRNFNPLTHPEGSKCASANPSNVLPESFTMAVPGRTGAVREVVPVMPEPGSYVIPSQRRKRDDKFDKPKDSELPASNMGENIELGPCGAARCKSRRVKVGGPEFTTKPNEESENKAASHKTGVSRADKHSVSKNKSNTLGDKKQASVRKFGNFVYTAGDTYPGMGFGHKNCVYHRTRVPANMGWLWNQASSTFKPRAGWKPGLIQIHIKEAMREAKATFLHGKVRPRSTPSKRRKGAKARQSLSYASVKKVLPKKKEPEPEVPDPPPTLHIQRKEGVYYVTMYPIKQEKSDIPQLQEPTKPLQFKIVKSRDSLASSTTASDMEIEFSPPAAVNQYKKKPDVIHLSTQVNLNDILNAFKSEKDSDKYGSKKGGKKGKDGKGEDGSGRKRNQGKC